MSGEPPPGEPEAVELPIDGELDLHAFSPRDVPEVVEEYLRACRERGILSVRVVHGRGKGVQRAVVRRLLRGLAGVRDCRDAPPGAGGWGATLVDLDPEPPRSASAPGAESADWQRQLREAFTSPGALLEHLGLEPGALPYRVDLEAPGFRMLVPRAFADRMRPGDPGDPLLRQVLPLEDETAEVPGFVPDPLAERAALAGPGVIRRFAGRALVVATGVCAVNCRYCFRRHFPYAELSLRRSQREELIRAVEADATLHEVILSGGDPLALADAELAPLLRELAAIGHVRGVRIHTRVPVVIPDRVTDDLVRALSELPVAAVVVLHLNHARELDGHVRRAVSRLRPAATALLNQSVLLAGVNDDPDALEALSWALLGSGVLPYYLHALDPAAGTGHFRVEPGRAAAIELELRRRLPGYLVPRFVRDGPDLEFKAPAGASPGPP